MSRKERRRLEKDAQKQAKKSKVCRRCVRWNTPCEVVHPLGLNYPVNQEDYRIPRKQDKPEEIVTKLCQIEVLNGQGMTIAQAAREVGTTEQTYYSWRKRCGGMSRNQLKLTQTALAHSSLDNTNSRLSGAAPSNFIRVFHPKGKTSLKIDIDHEKGER